MVLEVPGLLGKRWPQEGLCPVPGSPCWAPSPGSTQVGGGEAQSGPEVNMLG